MHRHVLDVRAVEGVLYDLDGVLIDSGEAWFRVVNRGRARYGYPAIALAEFRATFGQGVDADQTQFFPGQSVPEVWAFYESTFPEELDAVALNEGALEVLDALGARGLRQAVVTNTPRALALRILEAKRLEPHLDAVAAAGEAREKPEPDLLLLALKRLHLEPHQALYVGDSPTDLAAARAANVTMAGLGIAGYLRLATLRELLAILT